MGKCIFSLCPCQCDPGRYQLPVSAYFWPGLFQIFKPIGGSYRFPEDLGRCFACSDDFYSPQHAHAAPGIQHHAHKPDLCHVSLLHCPGFLFTCRDLQHLLSHGNRNSAQAEDKQRIRFFEMQESQYLAQQRYIAESSRQRHDFRQHLSSIAQMVQNRAFDELTGYLSEYLNTLPDSQTIYCQNVPANALLNYYASMMDQAQIRRNWKISLPENLQISDPELCSLLGNLLENVLHGCQTLPTENRYHNFTICLEHDRFLYLVSSNNFNGVVKQKNHQYLSTHKNGSGIGLSSIAIIAEKYQGIAQFSNTDKEFLINVVMDK